MAPPMGECARSQDIFEFSLITESHSHSRNIDACFVVEKKAVVEINPRLYSGPFITVDATWVQTKSGRILFTTGKLLNSPFSGFSPSFVIEITLFGHFEALWVLFFPPYLQTRQARVAVCNPQRDSRSHWFRYVIASRNMLAHKPTVLMSLTFGPNIVDPIMCTAW